MKKDYANTPYEGTVNSFSKDGFGLASVPKPDGTQRIVEIPFTLPGDVVKFTYRNKRSGVSTGKLVEILQMAPHRQQARCIHFGVCGGCRWQHIPYEQQLKIKQSRIEMLFSGIEIPSIVPCDPPWNYRNKMEFSFSQDAAGTHYLGLMMEGSRGKVLNLKECHLVDNWFVKSLDAIQEWWMESGLKAYHPHSNSGSLRTLTLREGLRTGDRLIMLTVSGNPDYALQKWHLETFTAFLRAAIEPISPDVNLSIFLRIQQAVKGQATQFYEMHLYGSDHIREVLNIQTTKDGPTEPLVFTISPSAFFQPNPRQAEKLYSLALQMLNLQPGSVIYDLYCGTGTLGICAAHIAKQVIGVELSPESALDARTNVANNKLKNIEIVTGSVADVMKKICEEKTYPMPHAVMVDPPRAGLDPQTLQHLISLRPPKILYISCNPSTQAENISVLKEAGYKVQAVQPVDQFPHTIHIENIVLLSL